MRNTGDLRGELQGMIHSDTVKPEDDDELSDEEEDMNDTDEEETKEKAAAHDPSFLTTLMESFMEKVSFLKSREGRAGLVHNFLRGLQLMTAPVPNEAEEVSSTADQLSLKAKRIYLVDSGLVFNSPYPLLLRPQRDVDIFLSFDFSARDKDNDSPFQELLLAEKWARENNFKFPPIEATLELLKDDYKEYYVFADPNDPICPVVVHFPLVNKTFKEQSKPGVPRKTAEELDFADFSIFEDPEGHYSTFNFHYTNKPFERLTKLCEFNTLLGEQTIKDVMADCVDRKRAGGNVMNGMNSMNGHK